MASDNLNRKDPAPHLLQEQRQGLVWRGRVPLAAVMILVTIAFLGLFAAGFDQGQLLGMIPGAGDYGGLYLHELTHDLRHAAGFPCH